MAGAIESAAFFYCADDTSYFVSSFAFVPAPVCLHFAQFYSITISWAVEQPHK
jgi:hypothetical protein